MIVNIIVAYCKNNGIGKDNSLPWKIPSDLKKFKKFTSNDENKKAIIMGKNTFASIKNKPLPNRDNLILSSTSDINKVYSDCIAKSFKNIKDLEDFVRNKNYNEIWIIGGESIYNLFMNNYPETGLLNVNNIYITYIDKNFDCDTYFPIINTNKYKFVSQEIHKIDEKFNVNDSVNEPDNQSYTILDVLYSAIL